MVEERKRVHAVLYDSDDDAEPGASAPSVSGCHSLVFFTNYLIF